MIKQVAKRTTLYSIGQISGKGISVIVFILLARNLGVTNFGLIALLNTYILVFTYLTAFGLVQWYQKYVKDDYAYRFSLVSAARLITIIIGLFLMVPVVVLTPEFHGQLGIILALLIFIESYLTLTPAHYFVTGETLKVAIQPSLKLLPLLFMLVLFPNWIDVNTIGWLMVLGSGFVLLMFYPWHLVSRTHISIVKIIHTLESSFKYALVSATSLIYARADQLVIQYSLGSTALGIYSAAYRYLDSLAMIPASLTQILFPITAKSKNITKKSIIQLTLLSAGVGFIFSITLFLLSGFLTTTLLGTEFTQTKSIVQILSIVAFIMFISAPLSAVVQSSDYVKKFIPWGIGNTAMNVVLNLILIPMFGISAAAWSMVITESTGLCINLYFTRKITHAN